MGLEILITGKRIETARRKKERKKRELLEYERALGFSKPESCVAAGQLDEFSFLGVTHAPINSASGREILIQSSSDGRTQSSCFKTTHTHNPK